MLPERTYASRSKTLGSVSRTILWVVLIIIVLWIIYIILDNTYTPGTNDATLQTHSVQIASQVDGIIIKLPIHNHEFVKQHQLLFQLDPNTYQQKVRAAQSQLRAAELEYSQLMANIKNAEDKIRLQESVVTDRYEYYNQIKTLKSKGYVSATNFNNISAQYHESNATLLALKQNLVKARAQLGTFQENQNHIISYAQANLANARIHLKQTHVVAPVSGYLTNIQVGVGSYAKKGQTIVTIITNDKSWVVANYRESSLTRMHVGDKAYVSLDVIPNTVFSGHVESIGWGVNVEQDLPNNYLPYIKSKRDWIRPAQRFPVNIELDSHIPKDYIRSGSSAYVTVFTTPGYPFNFLASWLHYFYSFFQYIF